MRNAKGRRRGQFRSAFKDRTSGAVIKAVSDSSLPAVVSSGDGYDEEALAWHALVLSNGGTISASTLDAVDGWMKTIKSSVGLRQKLKRVNLFAGDDLSSALVPIISDHGHRIDEAVNFTGTDYIATGNKAGLQDRNIVSGTLKYLKTGLSFSTSGITKDDGHVAINTMGSQERSTYVPFLGHETAGIVSGKKIKKYTFEWGGNSVEANHPNSQIYHPVMGFYLGNVKSSEISLWLNGIETATNSVSSGTALPSGGFTVFRTNRVNSPIPRALQKAVNYYSVGTSLTDAEISVLNQALLTLNKVLKREYYSAKTDEAWEWANIRTVEKIGDPYTRMNQKAVDQADRFITSVSGFKSKLDRVNLFLAPVGDLYGYNAAFVPIITKKGYRNDISHNFTHSDFSIQGLQGDGVFKYLETGVTSSSTDPDVGDNLHLSVKVQTPHTSWSKGVAWHQLIGYSDGTNEDNLSLSDAYLRVSKGDSNGITSYTHRLNGQSIAQEVSASSEAGFFTMSTSSTSGVRTYQGDTQTGYKGWVEYSVKGSSKLTLFAGYKEPFFGQGASAKLHSNAGISFYSTGQALTSSEVSILNKAVENVTAYRGELLATNSEVWEWANVRVPRNGGAVTKEEVAAVDKWMTTIKSANLKSKLDRVNLFVGKSLASQLVPIINSKGEIVDINYNFSESDVTSQGLRGGIGKFLDTGANLTNTFGYGLGSTVDSHFAIKNYTNLSSIGDRTFGHGLYNKDIFGFLFDADSITARLHDSLSHSYASVLAGTETQVYPSDNAFPKYAGNGMSTDASNWVFVNEEMQVTATSHGKYRLKWEGHIDRGTPNRNLAWRILKNGAEITSGDFNANASNPKLTDLSGRACSDISFANSATPATNCPRDYQVIIDNVSAGDKLEVQLGAFDGLNAEGHVTVTATSQQVTASSFSAHHIQAPAGAGAIGLWTASAGDQLHQGAMRSESHLYSDSVLKDEVHASSVLSYVPQTTDSILIFGNRNHEQTHDGSTRVGYYSIGDFLSSADVAAMSSALSVLEADLKRALDPEVHDWAHNRVPSNGGTVSADTISAVNDWMLSIKTDGLRSQLKRVNLFVGDDLTGDEAGKAKALKAAMVPVICDEGYAVDVNTGFTKENLLQGLTSDGNTSKYLRTGLKIDKQQGSMSAHNYSFAANVIGPRKSSSFSTIMGDGMRVMRMSTDGNDERLEMAMGDLAPNSFYADDSCSIKADKMGEGSSAEALSSFWKDQSHQSTFRYGVTMLSCIESNVARVFEYNDNVASLASGVSDNARKVYGKADMISATCVDTNNSKHLAPNYANEVIVFGNSSAGLGFGGFSGRLSSYVIGFGSVGNDGDKLSTHFKTLNVALRRGMFMALDSEVWDWAHGRVLDPSGRISDQSYRALTQSTIDSVDKFMGSIKGVDNMRSAIRRLNLFCGENLNTALVPLINDVGSASDSNTNFVEGDYTKTGKTAGLSSSGLGRILNTGGKCSELFDDDSYHISVKVLGGHSSNTADQGPYWLCGGVSDSKSRLMGIRYRQTTFYVGNIGFTNIVEHDVFSRCSYKPEDFYSCNIPSLITNVVPPPNTTLSSFLDTEYNCKGYNYVNPDTGSIIKQSKINKLYSDWKVRADQGSSVFKTFIDSPFWSDQGYNPFYNTTLHDRYCVDTLDLVGSQTTNLDSIPISLGSSDITKGDGLYSMNGDATNINLYHEGALKKTFAKDSETGSPNVDFTLFGFNRDGFKTSYPYSASVSFYCLGKQINSKVLQEALDTFEKDIARGYSGSGSDSLITETQTWDQEVALWANEKVPNNGGILSTEIVSAVNTWMLNIKSQSGLREKITRCNLFVGKNLEAALVPIISDVGSPVELNYGFTESDFKENRGLKSGVRDVLSSDFISEPAEKYLDTALFAGSKSKLLSGSGHLIVATPDRNPSSMGMMIFMSIVPSANKINSEGSVFLFTHSDSGGPSEKFYAGGSIGARWEEKLMVGEIAEEHVSDSGGLIILNRDPIKRLMSLYVDNTDPIVNVVPGPDLPSIRVARHVTNPDTRLIADSSLKIFGWSYGNSVVNKGYLGTISHYSVGDDLTEAEMHKMNVEYKTLRRGLGHMTQSLTGNGYRMQWV